MGSLSRYSAIEKVIHAFESEILSYFHDLIGLTVGQIGEKDIDVDHWLSAHVPLSGSPKWEGVHVHFGWATEEEYHTGKVKDENGASNFNKFFAGKEICSISVEGRDRDDEVYLYANIDAYSSLEIPLGFDPETLSFYGFMEEIISEEKRKSFVENYAEL